MSGWELVGVIVLAVLVIPLLAWLHGFFQWLADEMAAVAEDDEEVDGG